MISELRVVRTGGLALFAAALLSASASAASTPATSDIDWLREQTVRIELKRADTKKTFNGSGVVLCQVDRQVFVLTAKHVLFPPSEGNLPQSLVDVEMLRVSFFKDAARPAIQTDADDDTGSHADFKPQPIPGKDLLLLSFSIPEDLYAFATPGKAVPEAGTDRPQVQSVGYNTRNNGETWSVRSGTLMDPSDGLLHHLSQIGEGFSGGPVFNEAGAVIGINVKTSGTEDNAESTVDAFAIPIEVALEAVSKSVPASCLPNDDEAKWLRASNLYRQAMRWVRLKDWEKAEVNLREALAERDSEGGSVHLQGMRYTEYLPHYQLGRVLYHLDSRCDEAIREFNISERQRAIRDDRRYKRLKRIRDNCREKAHGATRSRV